MPKSTSLPVLHGGHAVGSQTPEPRANPALIEKSKRSATLPAKRRTSIGLLNQTASQDISFEGMDSLDFWSHLDDEERRQFTVKQAKAHRQYVQNAQRELHRQRELMASLRSENSLLRQKYQSKMEEQNDVLGEKHTQQVNHLMNLKFVLEEQVEEELNRLDQGKRQMRLLASKVKSLKLADKSNLYNEREHERTRQKNEDRVAVFVAKHSEEVAHGKKLREIINELRYDKLNFKKKIEDKRQESEDRSAEAVQLINIANELFTQRSQYRLAASTLIAEAGEAAEEHRAKMQELNNRIDYYDLVIQEREDDYQKMLLETERQAANVNDPSEEVKEAEKRRHQELIEAFDKLMHSFGVWDVDELVSRFLRKEEKIVLTRNYLDALTEDASKIRTEIQGYKSEASSMVKKSPETDVEVLALKEKISQAETKSSSLRQETDKLLTSLDSVKESLARIKERMSRCKALDEVKDVKRRWALLRANVQRIPFLASRAGDSHNRSQGVAKGPATKFDPRHKTIFEELRDFNDQETSQTGLDALIEVSFIEHRAMILLSKAQLRRQIGDVPALQLTRSIPKVEEEAKEDSSTLAASAEGKPRRKRRIRKGGSQSPTRCSSVGSNASSRGKDSDAGMKEKEHDKRPPPIVTSLSPRAKPGNVHNEEPEKALLAGPCAALLEVNKARTSLDVIPTLKEIETPREMEALSPREIRRQVQENGVSEKVLERMRRYELQKAKQDKQKLLEAAGRGSRKGSLKVAASFKGSGLF